MPDVFYDNSASPIELTMLLLNSVMWSGYIIVISHPHPPHPTKDQILQFGDSVGSYDLALCSQA